MATPETAVFPAGINYLLRRWQNSNLPGKYRLYRWLAKHRSRYVIQHPLGKGYFSVPVDEWCYWTERGPGNYYLDEFIPFFQAINRTKIAFDFFDLGADIGTVSALVTHHCQSLQRIIAFEPNGNSFELLCDNLKALDIEHFAENQAVSDFNGSANFIADSTRSNDHEGYIDTCTTGETPVITVDSWLQQNPTPASPLCVIKIDVEGQEQQVLEGARQLIQNSEQLILLLEFHPDVLERTGETPEDLMAAAEALRSFDWYLPLRQNQQIDRTQPFYAQYPKQQYDVIGIAQRAKPL